MPDGDWTDMRNGTGWVRSVTIHHERASRPELLRAYKELNHLRFPESLHVGEALISKGWAETSKGELIYYFAAPIDAIAAYRASGGLVGKAE